MSGSKCRLWAVTTCAVAVAVCGATVPLTSADADPGAVAAAQTKLEKLHEKSSEVEADYVQAQAKLDEATTTLKAAERDLAVEKKKVTAAKSELASFARARFQSASLDPTSRLLASPDDHTFLNQLATLQSVRARGNDRLQDFQARQARVQHLEGVASQARDDIAAEVAKQKKLTEEFDRQESEARKTLDRLTKEEQRRLAQLEAEQLARRQAEFAGFDRERQADNVAPRPVRATRGVERAAVQAESTQSVPTSGRADTAMSFALAQVGKSYRMGGTGMNSFDCSGLMQRAWASAGVALPRTSQAQFRAGRPVSSSDLQPGDLVFYYGGISHVGMYIGNGQIVHAANPRSGIRVAPLHSMPLKGARRVG